MRNAVSPSTLNPESASDPENDPYVSRRRRTAELTRQAVDSLVNEHSKVTLAAIIDRSKVIDPAGQGVSHMGILENDDARAYYEQYRTSKPRRRSSAQRVAVESDVRVQPVKLDRDVDDARRRYRRLSRAELIERLIAVEQAWAEAHEGWLERQDEVLYWQLEARRWQQVIRQMQLHEDAVGVDRTQSQTSE
jgi:hypothetical protein